MSGFRKLFLFIVTVIIAATVQAQPQPGELAYDINLKTPKGDLLSLDSLAGKVVLIDFWASWCGPCRMSNRQLVKLYSKYKSKGFEILGVSLDREKRDWVKAIAKDKINWPQVIDDRGWEAQTAIDWNVYQIPTSYLINKDGIVVSVNPEKKDLEKALKELLK
jgi:thiol-disulfide isomerase/thioredoxin